MYKVFFNEKWVILTDRHAFDQINKGVLYFQYDDFEEIHFILDFLDISRSLSGVIIYSDDLDILKADFRAHFKEIGAAGGLVSNNKNQQLFIHRNGFWDLPKGKLEGDESAEAGALREVEEECGIHDLELGDFIISTYHSYKIKGARVLKETKWFEMRSSASSFVPQGDEGIDKVEWKSKPILADEIHPTFSSIKEVLRARDGIIDRL